MEKMELPKKNKIKYKLTKREKNLLFILLIIIVIWIYYRFVITPQLYEMQELEGKKIEYESRIDQINSTIEMGKFIDEELEELNNEIDSMEKIFFNSLSQWEVINLLDEILNNNSFEVEDMYFYETVEEKAEDLSFKRIDVDIPYKGSYEGVVEVLKNIASYPKEIIINSVIIDSLEDEIVGTLSLSFYSLENRGKLNDNLISYDDLLGEFPQEPFEPFDGYEEVTFDDTTDTDSISQHEDEFSEEHYSKMLLEEFEEENFEFIPSNKFVQGNVFKSNKSKSKNYSIRLEYKILAFEDENRAYIDLSNKKISIKYPPSSIGIWIYSYSYSPSTIGFKLITQNKDEFYIPICEGISWIGWNYVETKLLSDLSLYPLQIDKIYVELTNFRDDFGVLLFDKLEANYPIDSKNAEESFIFHIVEEGENLDEISMKYFNTIDKKDLIKEYNDLQTDNISSGRVLVIPMQEEIK